jgi:hypothetical protein
MRRSPRAERDEKTARAPKNRGQVIPEGTAGKTGRIVAGVLARAPNARLDMEAIEMALRPWMHQLAGAILEKLLDADTAIVGPAHPAARATRPSSSTTGARTW